MNFTWKFIEKFIYKKGRESPTRIALLLPASRPELKERTLRSSARIKTLRTGFEPPGAQGTFPHEHSPREPTWSHTLTTAAASGVALNRYKLHPQPIKTPLRLCRTNEEQRKWPSQAWPRCLLGVVV